MHNVVSSPVTVCPSRSSIHRFLCLTSTKQGVNVTCSRPQRKVHRPGLEPGTPWSEIRRNRPPHKKSCELCQQVKRPVHAKPPPLQPLPADLFGRWHIDILSGLPITNDKCKHILVYADSYSKWKKAHPPRTQKATEIVTALYCQVRTCYGAPRPLVSDRGQTFMSKLTAAMCMLFLIKRLSSKMQ